MSSTKSRDHVLYYSRRRSAPEVRFDSRYNATSTPYAPNAGTLEHWLTERYCLFSVDHSGRLHCGEIHHPPWLLQTAQSEIRTNTMTKPLGISLPTTVPVLHFSKRQDVVAWTLDAENRRS